MHVDDCVLYTSEGCLVQLQLEKNSTEKHLCFKRQSLQAESSPWKYFLKAHIDRLSSKHGYTDYMALYSPLDWNTPLLDGFLVRHYVSLKEWQPIYYSS